MSAINEIKYVQYGCGLSAPSQWINFDASPTLRIQKMPFIGLLLRRRMKVVFPDNVVYGDIIKGLPVPENSCHGVFCSHTLEHLSLFDFRVALKNTRAILKEGGLFRCLLPDLETAARKYLEDLKTDPGQASILFLEEILLGVYQRPKTLREIITSFLGNSHHLWMWDKYSLKHELELAGFRNVRFCSYNDSKDSMFAHVENESRFINSICLECEK